MRVNAFQVQFADFAVMEQPCWYNSHHSVSYIHTHASIWQANEEQINQWFQPRATPRFI